eukprot:CAMPEP_0119039820 /NCGR_PEP_ID=MMETSP1177-20130426/9488_1 /TAXON_ID=2985 /ORGANISM="Ochromonas sp, Strain CCMP1899" /LENGTH=553 /DNA_ID=CAMNT_0007004159 /DNA_START=179 /DNA_END=1840 /DNA_ORIENTATION=-
MKNRGWMSMMSETAESVEVPSSSSGKKADVVDFAQYAIGQEYSGSLIGAKAFGVFVDIATGTNVLLPRSQMTKGNYEKLKRLADSKSKEQVRLEIIGVSAENSTLSGKFISGNYKNRPDLSALQGTDISSKFFNATVVGAHDFGLFAELDDYGVEGLVPASKLPEKMPSGSIQSSYPAGTNIKVQIEEFSSEGKKLVLSMSFENRADVGAFSDIPQSKWLNGVVQSVSPFGIFVRPAGYEMTGLVHQSRISRDLISALKRRAPITPGENKTDVESLFTIGDVVRVRTQAVSVGSRRLELSMMQFKDDEEEDDYVVEGRDPEGDEDKFQEEKDDDDEPVAFDAESTLVWWRGAPYTKIQGEVKADGDEDFKVLDENIKIVEGTWRRMFEVDMREDEQDFNSKLMEAEMKELEEEIGELGGMDDDMVDCVGFGSSSHTQRVGSFVSMAGQKTFASLPAEWKEEMDFFKELETTDTSKMSGLRAGKAAEQAEFETLLRAVELELDQAATRGAPRRRSEDEVLAVNDEGPSDPSMAAPSATEVSAPVVEESAPAETA